MYSAIGIHPSDVNKDNVSNILDIYNKYKGKKIVAIGEIGIDYAFVKDNKEQQINLFIEQIELANHLKLPIVIHSRDASMDTYNVVRNHEPKYGALFHCFNPSDELVRLVLEKDYMVAFGGNITYKRNESFERHINMLPIENIVIETDCPYLSPVPFRGKLNTSANLPIICQKLAEYKQMDVDYVGNMIFNNSVKFFNIMI